MVFANDLPEKGLTVDQALSVLDHRHMTKMFQFPDPDPKAIIDLLPMIGAPVLGLAPGPQGVESRKDHLLRSRLWSWEEERLLEMV